ncbi:DUF1127 domain-containing protein [Thalassospira sp.]|uniref:DUF1127 domain-containing protein n=1 Tax=Thalassospira sp. TaxID=1912094 RepID=UPI0027334197|nr:DUF1127 domain-containing protein [Thalassospira sp.]MDP2700064.1 DUF1127 domain-containing protein [Thalassospira sp.]
MAMTQCPSTSCQTDQHGMAILPVSSADVVHRILAVLNSLANEFARYLALRSQRRALMRLNSHQLADIGINRYDAEAEYRKSFKWF